MTCRVHEHHEEEVGFTLQVLALSAATANHCSATWLVLNLPAGNYVVSWFCVSLASHLRNEA